MSEKRGAARRTSGRRLVWTLGALATLSFLALLIVPRLTGCKQNECGASSRGAKSNAKIVQHALDSCAAGTERGTFRGGQTDCLATETLIKNDPALDRLFQPEAKCGEPPCVEVFGRGESEYLIVSRMAGVVSPRGRFYLLHRNDGTETWCDRVELDKEHWWEPRGDTVCPDGKW
jgi:hypothetical protein